MIRLRIRTGICIPSRGLHLHLSWIYALMSRSGRSERLTITVFGQNIMLAEVYQYLMTV